MLLSHRQRLIGAITVVVAAVILIVIALFNLLPKDQASDPVISYQSSAVAGARHPLNGQPLAQADYKFFPVAVILDNAWDIRPQYGLAQADIIYEALAESNITRLLAIYDSEVKADKVGPVRSAREYFLDWADDYGGSVFMHVGGSPAALDRIAYHDFEDIDQIGAGETYFWRDNKYRAPHNVFTSDSNWLRVGELRGLPRRGELLVSWNFQEASTTDREKIKDLVLDYNDTYKVEWRYNEKLGWYQRWQGDEPFIYDSGEQAKADNIIVQIVPSRVVDDLGRRVMDTKKGGQVFVFNKLGVQQGAWTNEVRTMFFDENFKELFLVPGKTWVQVIDSGEILEY